MVDYSKLSDFEINNRVASLCTIEGVVINDNGEPVRNIVDESPGSYSGGDYIEVDYDPCNNPADAWPIIVQNRISIINLDEDEWGARGVADRNSKRAIHENSLRAAMIVFLMMQDAKNG
ncbi:DUF2591 domain-containing protein [Escherichia coli]|uniref:phage protein NinX family protein n=1 Tax=Escherichia coli TaxID=562 RepID=UPI001F58EB43|nr:phage protein NinX family protein [Escherichia coli]MCI2234029.1 DUF2591 domain-containing protein [Escherichia coli]